MTAIKFTDKELEAIEAIRQEYSFLSTQHGQLCLTKFLVEKDITDNLRRYEILVAKEQESLKLLNAKYGEGSLDLSTGTFVPRQQSASPVIASAPPQA